MVRETFHDNKGEGVMDKNKKNLIYMVVAFAFILLTPLIPAPEGLTTASMHTK